MTACAVEISSFLPAMRIRAAQPVVVRLRQWAAWLAQDRPPAPDVSNPLMLMMFSALGFVKRPVTEMA